MLACLGLTTLVLLWMTLHDPHPRGPAPQWSDPEAEKTQEALKAQIALDTQKKMDEQNLWKNLDNIQNATLGVCLTL
jgi:apolipoprotein N-acyltransferase